MKRRLIQRISGHESSSSASSTRNDNFDIKISKNKDVIIKTEYFDETPTLMTMEDKEQIKELII